MTSEEPLFVTFARVVRGWKGVEYDPLGVWWGRSPGGWRDTIPRYDLDRAFCQELAEINGVNLTYCKSGKTWSSEVVSDELAERIFGRLSESMCETIITWAIAATGAGVPVRLPGGER